jgi:hypothetical protein
MWCGVEWLVLSEGVEKDGGSIVAKNCIPQIGNER